jgi:hypothetical protein
VPVLETARLAFKEPEPGPCCRAAPNSEALRTLVTQIGRPMAEHREGHAAGARHPRLRHHGLDGLDVRMGAFVVLRGRRGAHTVAGQLYVE